MVAKYPMLKVLEFDLQGSGNLQIVDENHTRLKYECGEIKSRDPSKYSARKAAKQMYQRMYLLAFAANACGLSQSGDITCSLYSSFSNMHQRIDSINSVNSLETRPWKLERTPANYYLKVLVVPF